MAWTCFLTHTVTMNDVIQFSSSVFSRHGNPENIVTDNGTQFTSEAFASFLQNRGISHTRTSVYYPATNVAVGRFHRALRACVQTAIQQATPRKDVSEWLQVYRETPRAATSTSPYELPLGRKMRTKLNILPTPPVTSTLHDRAQREVLKHQTKRGARVPSFQTGERVRRRNPLQVPKGHPRFTPPATIKKIKGKHTFMLSDGRNWNVSHLTRCAPVAGHSTHSTATGQENVQSDSLPLGEPPRAKYKPSWDFVMS